MKKRGSPSEKVFLFSFNRFGGELFFRERKIDGTLPIRF